MPGVKGIRQTASDEAVREATGHTWDEWFRILDEAGCAKREHKAIVEEMQVVHRAPDWWSQMISVAYEQARGVRVPGQKADGFSISKSVTVRVSAERAFEACASAAVRDGWLGTGLVEIRKATAPKSVRMTWLADQSLVEINLYSKGAEKVQVAFQQSKLATSATADRQREFWIAALERLREALVEPEPPAAGASQGALAKAPKAAPGKAPRGTSGRALKGTRTKVRGGERSGA